jgi:hypothetical protein
LRTVLTSNIVVKFFSSIVRTFFTSNFVVKFFFFTILRTVDISAFASSNSFLNDRVAVRQQEAKADGFDVGEIAAG